MRNAFFILAVAFAVTGCTTYEPDPRSPLEWQRRQERIEREVARAAAAAENNPAPAPRTGDQ